MKTNIISLLVRVSVTIGGLMISFSLDEMSFADDASGLSYPIEAISEHLEDLKRGVSSVKPCSRSDREHLTDCQFLSDSFCRKLQENKGNLPEAGLLLGPAENQVISKAEEIDLQALVDAAPRLPQELSLDLEIVRSLSRLKQLLFSPKNDSAWLRDVQKQRDVFSKRVERSAQSLAQTALMKQTGLPASKLQKSRLKLETQRQQDRFDKLITSAKYENHPNWKRVEATYAQVKADMREVIRELPFAPEQKERLLQKVESVKLGLPQRFRVAGPIALVSNDDCSINMRNAYYRNDHRVLSVCAGYFNSYQSEASAYFVLAHELAHSIAPDALAKDSFDASKSSQIVRELVRKDGNAFSCEEWNRYSNELSFVPPYYAPVSATDPWDDLSVCFRFGAPVKQRFVEYSEVKKDVEKGLSNWALNDFSSLFRNETGSVTYLQPANLLQLSLNDQLAKEKFYRLENYFDEETLMDAPSNFLFAQNMRCDPLFPSLEKGSSLPLTRLGPILDRTKAQLKGLTLQEFSENRAAPKIVDESFSDWVGKKVLSKRLARIDSVTERREFVARSTAVFCDQSKETNLKKFFLELSVSAYIALTSDYFEKDGHPDHRGRRLGIYSENVGEQLRCELSRDGLRSGGGYYGCTIKPRSSF